MDTFARETDGLVDLYVDGEVISTTKEHPFWTPDKGWVEAKDLTVGSLLQTDDGRIIDVDRVEKQEGKFEVYNFKVEDFHTYFVSDLGILVHNADYPSGFSDKPKKIAKETGRTDQEIRDAIHKVKNKALSRDGGRKNPDVVVEIATGDVFPKLPDGSMAEDPIGNIFDYLDEF